MKNIRQKVFETNSSSTHSISISKNSNGILESLYPDAEGKLLLEGGQFGWEWQRYNDALTKANYCAIFSKNGTPEMVDMLVSVIKEHTGAKEITFGFSSEYDGGNWSYIDHQSDYHEGGAAMDAFSSPDKLKNFIFNSDSWLFTGNDNEDDPPNFYDTPGTQLNFKLELEGSSVVEKFTAYPTSDDIKESLRKISEGHPLCTRPSTSYSYSDRESIFRVQSWPVQNIDGGKTDSWSKFDQGIVVLYKTEAAYNGDGTKYLGEKINAILELKFNIVPINEVAS